MQIFPHRIMIGVRSTAPLLRVETRVSGFQARETREKRVEKSTWKPVQNTFVASSNWDSAEESLWSPLSFAHRRSFSICPFVLHRSIGAVEAIPSRKALIIISRGEISN